MILKKQSPGGVLYEKVFLEILQISQVNTCAKVSFLIKLQTWALQLYLKRESGTGAFSLNFAKFLRTHFLQNTSWRLFLVIVIQILRLSKIYVNESVNRQSGLVMYLPTTIIFNLNHDLKQIIFPGIPWNLKKPFCISKKCNKGDITG